MDLKGLGRSLSGRNPEGIAPRADVITETMGTMGTRDAIGFGTGVPYPAGAVTEGAGFEPPAGAL